MICMYIFVQDVCILKQMVTSNLLNIFIGTDEKKQTPERSFSGYNSCRHDDNDNDNRNDVTTYVELGAGNGLLGLAVTTALQRKSSSKFQLVLLERAGTSLLS